jgi:nicotinate phosphoribosyltransferase
MNIINNAYVSDKYQYTMGKSYLDCGKQDQIAVFNLFYRQAPESNNWAVVSGTEEVIQMVQALGTEPEEFYEKFLPGDAYKEFRHYLAGMKFTGDLYCMREGEIAFPNQPIVTVVAPMIEAQVLETPMLCILNHQMAVATKASRVCRSTDKPVSEFGSRRAQGIAGAVTGARAAFIGGCAGTACTVSDQLYGVPAAGTMAHSWVQMFDSELDAFRSYCRTYPNNAVLLVDTYNTLKSGVPNAIKAFNEILKPLGITKCGIRLDSGDMAYLTQKARKMLDDAGWTGCTITVSNSLDERLIANIIHQGAKIDSFGVGERLITSKSEPVFGGVYKLCAVENDDGSVTPKIKVSENVGKITNPGFKKVYRFFNRETGMAEADYICMRDEVVDDTKPLEICDPSERWKRKTMENFRAVELQVPVFLGGELVYELPTLKDIKTNCGYQISTLWPEVKRFDNPHTYYVDLSPKLMALKDEMLENHGRRKM